MKGRSYVDLSAERFIALMKANPDKWGRKNIRRSTGRIIVYHDNQVAKILHFNSEKMRIEKMKQSLKYINRAKFCHIETEPV